MPTFPSPPDIRMQVPWSLYNGTTTFYFDVPGVPHWSRPEPARVAESPCGGPATLLTSPATLQPRQFRIQIWLWPGTNRNTRQSTLESLYAARGPYTLSAPVFPSTCSVIFDPSQGVIEWDADNGSRIATVAFREV